jgi:hypothetical protein
MLKAIVQVNIILNETKEDMTIARTTIVTEQELKE